MHYVFNVWDFLMHVLLWTFHLCILFYFILLVVILLLRLTHNAVLKYHIFQAKWQTSFWHMQDLSFVMPTSQNLASIINLFHWDGITVCKGDLCLLNCNFKIIDHPEIQKFLPLKACPCNPIKHSVQHQNTNDVCFKWNLRFFWCKQILSSKTSKRGCKSCHMNLIVVHILLKRHEGFERWIDVI